MSGRVKVESSIKIYEVNGKETKFSGRTVEELEAPSELKILSHWNRSDFAVIRVNGKDYTVVISDLEAALRNAGNSG